MFRLGICHFPSQHMFEFAMLFVIAVFTAIRYYLMIGAAIGIAALILDKRGVARTIFEDILFIIINAVAWPWILISISQGPRD